MNSSPPTYAPSPTSDDLPPIPSISGIKPHLHFTIPAPAVPTLTTMPQASTPAIQHQVTATVQATQYRVPAQISQYSAPVQTPQYSAPAQNRTTTFKLPLATQVPGTISAPQARLQNQKMRLEPYTEKSFIVRGDTRPYKTQLKMMKGRWVHKPRDGREPGWTFGNFVRPEVEKYVQSVNNGTAAPPPIYEVQTVSWTMFKPEEGMKLKIAIPGAITDYTVASIEKEGWYVIKATIFCPQQPSSVHEIVIINGKWQILGQQNLEHTIEPAS
uniref:Uncharacterized protein n=1 Tax=Pithovirus LCPAC202 TaxID=2506592 RepID=A0A481Z6P6_9VIRU|nr:MAG: uncharacterized protein LCPAC202_02600 [Pithovirus LCPAC202]